MVYRSQSPTNQSESFYQPDSNQEQHSSYYGSNPDLIPIKNCKLSLMFPDCKSSQLFPDSDSGLMTGPEGPQQFCSQLDSALLLGNQRVAVKTLPGAGAGQRQSPSHQPPPPPLVPPFSGSSITPSRYCDNVSLGKSSKRANWPNGYRKTISIFLDVIGRNIEVNPLRRGCWGYWHKELFLFCWLDTSSERPDGNSRQEAEKLWLWCGLPSVPHL